MTNIELLQKILALVPDAACSIHELSERSNADDGINPIYTLSNFLVVWNVSNVSPCPTQAQIDAQA